MSIDLYTDLFFKGYQIPLDIGSYYPEDLHNIHIQSLVINDNVAIEIRYIKDNERRMVKLCGPQSKRIIDKIDNITSIKIYHSICDPYNDVNSILNRYTIGPNYSIKENKNIKPQSDGYIDFWYNNHKNRENTHKYVKQYKEKYPLLRTNNIADCKLNCQRISNFYGRVNCDLNCIPNNKLDLNKAYTNKCSYGLFNDINSNYKSQ